VLLRLSKCSHLFSLVKNHGKAARRQGHDIYGYMDLEVLLIDDGDIGKNQSVSVRVCI